MKLRFGWIDSPQTPVVNYTLIYKTCLKLLWIYSGWRGYQFIRKLLLTKNTYLLHTWSVILRIHSFCWCAAWYARWDINTFKKKGKFKLIFQRNIDSEVYAKVMLKFFLSSVTICTFFFCCIGFFHIYSFIYPIELCILNGKSNKTSYIFKINVLDI